MKNCQQCGEPVTLSVETRAWEGVILSAIEVYRCANGHDYLVIPKVAQLIALKESETARAFIYGDVDEEWHPFVRYEPLPEKLYVLEERELPDGDWFCDDLMGFDSEEEAVDALRGPVALEREELRRDDEMPVIETRIVLYERRQVVRVINDKPQSN